MKAKRWPSSLLVTCLFVAMLLLSGCGGSLSPQPPSGPSTSTSASGTPTTVSTANVVSGTVVDTQSNPVSGAMIIVDGITNDSGIHEHYTTQTDASGAYSLQVADGNYNVYAFITKVYENATWSLQLNPTDNSNDLVNSSNGITKNFQWELSGQMPGTDGTNCDQFYGGGAINVYLNVLSSVPTGATFTFTLAPNGPLIDGSTGKTITFQRTQQDLSTPPGSASIDNTNFLCDIPIGDYTITGQVTASDGTTQTIIFDGSSSEEISWATHSQPSVHIIGPASVTITIGS